jgi:hypothetical protein
MQPMKLEEGKFYTWGGGRLTYKIKEGVTFSFDKEHPEKGWCKTMEISSIYYCADWREVINPEMVVEGTYWAYEGGPRGGYYTYNSNIWTWNLHLLFGSNPIERPCVDDPRKWYQVDINGKRLDKKDTQHEEKTMQETKEKMTFAEALKWMEDGNYCIQVTPDIKPLVHKLKNDGIYYYMANEWVKDNSRFNEYLESDWEKVENPEKNEPQENQLGLSQIRLKVCLYHPVQDAQKARAWADAIKTFFSLKSHPLAKKPVENESQSVILLKDDKIVLEAWCIVRNKLQLLSSLFSSDEDAKKAISDIGEENLIHMFKTFQGVE